MTCPLAILCLLLSCQSLTAQDQPKLYIYSYKTGPSSAREEQLTRAFPEDSIFYHNGYAIEKIMQIVDLNWQGRYTQMAKFRQLYFIDFQKQRFADIDTSFITKLGSQKLKWKPLTEKNVGIQVGFIYYREEPVVKKEMLVGGVKYSTISYTCINPGHPENGSSVTIYLQRKSGGPQFFNNLEGRFKARVSSIKVVYPFNQGQAMISVRGQDGAPFALSRLISDIVARRQAVF